MEVVPHQGLEAFNHSGLEVVNQRGHQELYPAVGDSKALPPQKRMCGLSRAIFWLAVAITILAIIITGLAIGLGVTLSRSQNVNANGGAATGLASLGPTASSSPLPTQTSSTLTSTPTSTVSSTGAASSTSTTSSTSTSSDVPQPSNICPGANNTIVTPSLGKVRYLVACDSDFGPGDGKTTLASFFAATWDDCLRLCNTMNYFQNRADVGCVWNVAGTGTQTPGTCWCNGGAGKVVVTNRGNVAGVPQ